MFILQEKIRTTLRFRKKVKKISQKNGNEAALSLKQIEEKRHKECEKKKENDVQKLRKIL